MYLREMGSVELLSREGEITIAKRIEAGREMMIGGICEPAGYTPGSSNLTEQVRDEVALRDVIDLDLTFVRLNGSPIEDNSSGIPADQALTAVNDDRMDEDEGEEDETEQLDDEEEDEGGENPSGDRTDEDEFDDMTLSLAAMESAVYEDVMAQIAVIDKMFKKYANLQDKEVAIYRQGQNSDCLTGR